MAFYRKKLESQFMEKKERFIPKGGWNTEFNAVFDFITNGKGNGAINAVAGGGKTTAIVESAIRYTEVNKGKRVLFIAYNASIKEEGASRLAGYPIDVMTCHGLGYSALRTPGALGNLNSVQFDVQGSNGEYMQLLASNEIGNEKEKYDEREALLDLVSKCKTCLVDTEEGALELMVRFGITTSYSSKEFVKKAIKIVNFTKTHCGTTVVAGKGGKNYKKVVITFDDQVWLPIVKNLPTNQYDAVFIDEAQDLSAARRALIKKALKKNGRVFLVGDVHQSCYGFAGADIDSLPMMIDEFDCQEFNLSCTWRCPQSVVNEASNFNPNIIAAAGAKDGTVDTMEANDLINNINCGSVLLSRTNAPLIRAFFQLARRKVPVKFIGKDYGAMLAHRIKGWQFKHDNAVAAGHTYGEFTAITMLEKNDDWLAQMKKMRTTDEKKGQVTDRMKDEHATIIALTDGLDSKLDSAESIKEILKRCYSFSPEEAKDDKNTDKFVTLSSVHRFKGLERDKVFVLTDTFDAGSENIEESNLMYIAITRSKDSLIYVKGKLPTHAKLEKLAAGEECDDE